MQCDVLVVGGGPVGLTSANFLASYGIQVFLVEPLAEVSCIPKAASLDSDGQRIFQNLKTASNDIVNHSLNNLDVHFMNGDQLNGKSLLVIKNERTFHNYHHNVNFMYQPVVETSLRQNLEDINVTTFYGYKFINLEERDDFVIAEIQSLDEKKPNIKINCKYLFGCDGGSSSVRKNLGIKLKGRSFQDNWFVVDATTSKKQPGGECFRFLCGPQKVTGCQLPLPGNHFRWEFGVPENEVEQIKKLNSYEVARNFLKLRNVDIDSLDEVGRTAIYTFHSRVASEFNTKRVFLLGDAAHLMPPFRGQGLVSGLRDSFNLCWKIAFVLKENENENTSSLLKTYKLERLSNIKYLLFFSTNMQKLMLLRNKPICFFRDLILFLGKFYF